MKRQLLTMAAAAGLVLSSMACQSSATGPASPAVGGADNLSALGPGNTSLKAGAPTLVAPLNNAVVTSLTPTLSLTGGALKYTTATLQYRFRVTDDKGTVVADSGVQTSTSWTLPAPLTPTSTYTWVARTEVQGLTGPWSTSLKFTTPVAPGNDYGAWETACQGLQGFNVVVCVWNIVRPTNSVEDLEVSKRVAWLLRSGGAGLLLKSSGDNTVPWLGYTFSASRICYPDGQLWKIISDAGPGGANQPIFSDNGLIDPLSCMPAMNPRLR